MASSFWGVLLLGLALSAHALPPNLHTAKVYVSFNQNSSTRSAPSPYATLLSSKGHPGALPTHRAFQNSTQTTALILSLVDPTPTQTNIPTLTATAAPGHDHYDFKHLRPDTNGTMYYADPHEENNTDSSLLVEIAQSYKLPTVNLEYSNHYKEIHIEEERVSISFHSEDVFIHVQEQWQDMTGMVLIGSADISGHRDWFYCEGFKFDSHSLSVEIRGHKTDLETTVDTFDLSWGQHKPCRRPGGCGSGDHPRPNKTCGSPPVPTFGSLPLASCGPGFDAALDRLLGTYEFPTTGIQSLYNSSAFKEFVPGYANAPKCINGTLARRWPFDEICDAIGGAVESTVGAIIDTGEDIVSGVGDVISDIGDFFSDAAEDIGNWVSDAVEWVIDTFSVEPSITFPLPIDLGPSPEVSSPWGSAFKLWNCGSQCAQGSDVSLYCVDCGFHGKLYTTGSIRVSPILGVIGGTVRITGDLTAGVNLGLDAQGLYNGKVLSQRIMGFNPLGFEVPGVISIGPEVTLDVDADVNVRARGQVEAGIDLVWQQLDMSIDLMAPWNSYASGFEPDLKNVFQAKGQVSAGASIGLPFGVRFGIDLLNGAFAIQAGMVERPGLGFEANYDTYTCDGVDWSINLLNDVNAVYPGGEMNLLHSAYPLASDCLGTSKIHINKRDLSGISRRRKIEARSLEARDKCECDCSKCPDHHDHPHGPHEGSGSKFCVPADPKPAINSTTVRDTTGTYSLLAGADGNLWLGNATAQYSTNFTQFAAANNTIVGDTVDRILHYYPKEIEQFGVSRIRLAPLASTPQTSQAISLVPKSYGSNGGSILTAIDTLGNAFFLAWCGLQDQGARIFLVEDPSSGIQTLVNTKELVWAVLGAVPGTCNLIGLTTGVGGV